jgi:hypothetical protein
MASLILSLLLSYVFFQLSRFASSFRLEVFDWNQVGGGIPLGMNLENTLSINTNKNTKRKSSFFFCPL